jgi:hypothetical protein
VEKEEKLEKQKMGKTKLVVPVERVEQTILYIRGLRVILATDLARLYGVTTKRLNEQVKRNRDRFPEDFIFQLSAEEKAEVVANCDHLSNLKFSKTLPYAFTEHGAIMAASVLNTPRAIDAGIFVVRAFVRLREMVSTHKKLEAKLSELEHKIESHDENIKTIFEAIRQLMTPPEKPKRKIGFDIKEPKAAYGGNRKRGLSPQAQRRTAHGQTN